MKKVQLTSNQFIELFNVDVEGQNPPHKIVGIDHNSNYVLATTENASIDTADSHNYDYFLLEEDEFHHYLDTANSSTKRTVLTKLILLQHTLSPNCNFPKGNSPLELIFYDNNGHFLYEWNLGVVDRYSGQEEIHRRFYDNDTEYTLWASGNTRYDENGVPQSDPAIVIDGKYRINHAFNIFQAFRNFKNHQSITAQTGTEYDAELLCKLLCYVIDNPKKKYNLFDIEKNILNYQSPKQANGINENSHSTQTRPNATHTSHDFALPPYQSDASEPMPPKNSPSPQKTTSFQPQNNALKIPETAPEVTLPLKEDMTLFTLDMSQISYVGNYNIHYGYKDKIIIYLDINGIPCYRSSCGKYRLTREYFAYFVNTAYNNKIITPKQYNSYFSLNKIWDNSTPPEESAQMLLNTFVYKSKNSPQSQNSPTVCQNKPQLSKLEQLKLEAGKKLFDGIHAALQTDTGQKVLDFVQSLSHKADNEKAPGLLKSFAGSVNSLSKSANTTNKLWNSPIFKTQKSSASSSDNAIPIPTKAHISTNEVLVTGSRTIPHEKYSTDDHEYFTISITENGRIIPAADFSSLIKSADQVSYNISKNWIYPNSVLNFTQKMNNILYFKNDKVRLERRNGLILFWINSRPFILSSESTHDYATYWSTLYIQNENRVIAKIRDFCDIRKALYLLETGNPVHFMAYGFDPQNYEPFRNPNISRKKPVLASKVPISISQICFYIALRIELDNVWNWKESGDDSSADMNPSFQDLLIADDYVQGKQKAAALCPPHEPHDNCGKPIALDDRTAEPVGFGWIWHKDRWVYIRDKSNPPENKGWCWMRDGWKFAWKYVGDRSVNDLRPREGFIFDNGNYVYTHDELNPPTESSTWSEGDELSNAHWE